MTELEIYVNELEISLIRDISNSAVNTVQINKIYSRKNVGTCSCELCSEV